MTESSDRIENKPLRIGLTGGIASGKSMVADFFSDLGITIVDTDVISREVVLPGSDGLGEIHHAFGSRVMHEDGTLDRSSMRKIIFASADKRQQLESILHPRIQRATIQQVETASGPYIVIVVPLLVDSPMRNFMDRILVVDCSEATQMRRLCARDSENKASAQRIIAAQSSRTDRLAIADDIICNDDGRDRTRAQVLALHQSYLEITAN